MNTGIPKDFKFEPEMIKSMTELITQNPSLIENITKMNLQ
jgi:hypothetical protein